ncbi:MAG: hypothetical protein U1F65_06130 [Verrucomicrobiota bacterium]
MRTLTDQEKKTVRYAGIFIGAYLVLFGGLKVWNFFDRQRTEYRRLVVEAQNLKAEVKRYEGKIAVTTNLMERFRLDPAKLNRSTIVAEASAAIQKAAKEGGFQLGTIRETPGRPSGREIGSIQLEGFGPVQATMTLFNRLETCGYPLVIDSAQISLDPTKPNQTKLNLTIIILDFDATKKPEVPRA